MQSKTLATIAIAMAIGATGVEARAQSTPLYFNAVSTGLQFDELIAEDANADGHTWYFLTQGAHNRFNFDDKTIPADDYLYTPALSLEAGAQYTFSVDARSYGQTDHAKLSLVVVKGEPKHTASLVEICPLTDLPGSYGKFDTLQGTFTCTQEGTYYFGVHDTTDAWKYGPLVKNFQVSAATYTDGPGAVTDFTATAAMNGDLLCEISLKAPTLNVLGEALTSLDRVELLRDNDLIATFTPEIGGLMTFTDTKATNGSHRYRAIPYNSHGNGAEASVTAFVGFTAPMPPKSIHVERGENNGQMILSWEAAEQDENGKTYPAGAVTYNVYRIVDKSPTQIGDNFAGLSITDQAMLPDGRNAMVMYQVTPRYGKEYGRFLTTEIETIGKPYPLPFRESFANAVNANNWRTYQDYNSSARWELKGDSEFSSVQSHDDDNGFLCFSSSAPGDATCYISAAIQLDEDETPRLTFYTYKVAADCDNVLNVWVRDCLPTENAWDKAASISFGEGYTLNWNKQQVDLTPYAGKQIQVCFEAVCGKYSFSMIDDIAITNTVAVDFKAESIGHPGIAYAGVPFELTVNYLNQGVEESGPFQVRLFREDNLVDVKDVANCGGGQRGSVSFTQCLPVIYEGESHFHADIVSEREAFTGDNTTRAIALNLQATNLPTPSALTAQTDGQDVVLEWVAPDMEGDGKYPVVKESFEGYVPFAESAGAWKFLDRDGGPTASISGIEIPGRNPSEPATWTVFDRTFVPGLNPSALPFEDGDKALFVIYNEDGTPNDDWAISPRLSGLAQTISLRVLAMGPYGDTIEILASSSGTEPEDFTPVSQITSFTTHWKDYTASLPEGTQYFALRYCSTDAFAIWVDEVEYQAYLGSDDLELKGYNLYRNGERINSAPIAEAAFRDEALPYGHYMYMATAQYGEAESAPSQYAFIVHRDAGLDSAESSSLAFTQGRRIVVRTDMGRSVGVYSLQGELLYQTQGSCTFEAPAAGLYIVNIDGESVKLLVK